MNNKNRKKLIKISLTLIVIAGIVARIIYVNKIYPEPKTKIIAKGDTVQFAGFEITILDSWKFDDVTELKAFSNDLYEYKYKDEEKRGIKEVFKDEKLIIVKLRVKKIYENTETKYFSNQNPLFHIISGAYHNPFEIESVMINGNSIYGIHDLNVGEEKECYGVDLIPAHLMSEERWENFTQCDYYLNISFVNYPVKYLMEF